MRARVVVLHHVLVQQIVAEALSVLRVGRLAGVPGRVLGVVGGLRCVHPRGGRRADGVNVVDGILREGLGCLALLRIHLLEMSNERSGLGIGIPRDQRHVDLVAADDGRSDRVHLAGFGEGVLDKGVHEVIGAILPRVYADHPEGDLHALAIEISLARSLSATLALGLIVRRRGNLLHVIVLDRNWSQALRLAE